MQKRHLVIAGFPSSGTLKAQAAISTLLGRTPTSVIELDSAVPCMTPSHQVPLQFPLPSPLAPFFTHHVCHGLITQQLKQPALVYVHRDPLDSFFSAAGYFLPRRVRLADYNGEQADIHRLSLLDEYLALGGSFREIVSMGYGTWSSHIFSWLEWARLAGVPTLVIPFDSMRKNGQGTLTALASFLNGLGHETGREDIAGAQNTWTLENTRQWEENAINTRTACRFYKPALDFAYEAGWRYHGKGGSGYLKDRMSPAQNDRFDALFKPMENHLQGHPGTV